MAHYYIRRSGSLFKISTVLYIVAAILFGIAALSLGDKFPIIDIGLVFVASGLAVGSIDK